MNKCNLFLSHMVICWGLGKKSLYAFSLLIVLIIPPGDPLSFWNIRNDWAMSMISDIYLPEKWRFQPFALHIGVIRHFHVAVDECEKLRPQRRATYLLSKEKYNETRADCQRTEHHSSVNLLKVWLVDVLLLWWGTYVHSSCATINRQWLCAS